MSSKPGPVRLVPNSLQPGETGALRQPLGDHGRIHLDRWLPFLFLCRVAGDEESLARRITTNSPAYCLWDPDDDHAARPVLAENVAALAKREGKVLVVTLVDGPLLPDDAGSSRLPPFETIIHAPQSEDSDRAADA
ncbi:MAG: hypothetical protein ACREBM_05215, partial [Sphingomicrobium sp.]